ncbi:hypothetical protein KP509_21G039600 [Ceratopteris richardii]|uniref:Tetratricopeptide repeat protein n=1 Tax=Ceratopteris richardii TaxID=49495 RepID=A0A8T2SCG0_CERRI|nr:hypothetical protein KP509_21G039600 [Ceratopteris richardii]
MAHWTQTSVVTMPIACILPQVVSLSHNASRAGVSLPVTRRTTLLKGVGFLLLPLSPSVRASENTTTDVTLRQIEPLLLRASEAWGRALDPNEPRPQDRLDEVLNIFDKIIALDPEQTEWWEARGQARIDAKRFEDAVSDFTEAIRRNSSDFKAYSGRALAYEGLSQWEHAVLDYTTALENAKISTGSLDPYIINSRGNAFASLGKYKEALQDYLLSVQGFQQAKELDGAIYAAGNAALMRIQLGDEVKGMKELMGVARRAPASIDMRAALAALYWSQGLEQAAEDEWHFTCDNINPGQVFDSCALYRDPDWLRRIRRWPPVMVERMERFLKLRSVAK